MTSRSHLGWPVPRSVWERHLEHVRSEWGSTDLYAGIEAERIVKLGERIETTDAAELSPPTGDPPKTNEKKEQEPDTETRLEDQEKEYVQVSFNDDVADTVRARADQYDVKNGVMLAYMIREYYDTDGWGYSIEAAEADATGEREAATDTDNEEIPYRVEDKKDYICERIEPDPNGTINGRDLRELISDVAGGSRVDDYLPDILERLNYVHHPHIHGLYIPEDDLADYGLTTDDPAIDRKPPEALDRPERVGGIKEKLRTTGAAMSVGRIHEELFDGNYSTQHIRNLAKTIAESDDFTYKKTPGGTKVLRATSTSGRAGAESVRATDGGSESG